MYSKEETVRLKQQFWIAFGKYMKPVPAADGLPTNWINYKTGVKYLHFRMNAEQFKTSISIEITHDDEITSKLFFEHFEAYKAIFFTYLNEEWEWNQCAETQGLLLSEIKKTICGLNIYNQNHWPEIISFLKPRIIALDEFWVDVKPFFEALG